MEITLEENDVQTELDEKSETEVEMDVSVTSSAIGRELDRTFDQLKDQVDIPGFRKGNVPASVVRKKYGQVVKDELLGEFVRESLRIGLETHEVEAVGEPEFETEPSRIEEEEPIEFRVNIERKPVVDIPDYEDIEIEVPSTEVTEEDVDNAIDNMRKEHSELKWVEDAEVQENDVVVTDAAVTVEGEEVLEQQNIELQVNEKIQLFHSHRPELYEELLGLKSGDDLTTTLTFPEDTEPEELQGEEGTVQLDIHEVKRAELPEVDEEFASEFGFDSLEEFRADIRDQVQQAKERDHESVCQEEAIDALIEEMDIEVPSRLLEMGHRQFLQRRQMEMQEAGVPPEVIQEKLEEKDEMSKNAVKRYLRRQYIIDEIAEEEKIFVTESELSQHLKELGSQHDKWEHEVREELEENDMMDEVRSQLKEQKVLDFLLDQIEITETSQEEDHETTQSESEDEGE